MLLVEEQIRKFDDLGYIFLNDVFSLEEIRIMKKEILDSEEITEDIDNKKKISK